LFRVVLHQVAIDNVDTEVPQFEWLVLFNRPQANIVKISHMAEGSQELCWG